MGRFSITSETAFSQSREEVYDYAADPNNWGKAYKGSGGMHHEVSAPIKHGDVWTERVELPENTYLSKWTAITVERPWRFCIQQQNDIAMKEDGTGGIPGITTITYTFEDVGEGITLFTRNLTGELPRGVSLPDDLLTVCCRPQGIEGYHDAIKKALNEKKA